LHILSFYPFAAPIALAIATTFSFFEPGLRPLRLLQASRNATLFALAVAISSIAYVAIFGPETSPLIGGYGIGFAVRLDMLSAIMFALASFVGVIVVQFSRKYMDGDANQASFVNGLSLTIAAVMLLVLSGNLAQFVLAWIATSLSLHRLLVFYRDRPAARLAARKKFITARLSDACLIAACALLVSAFGTFDIADLLDRAQIAHGTGTIPAAVPYAAGLLALAALLKSAQFPAHGWLLEVMETPTPVSALLHAGIINAGGFLIARFADVMILSAASLHFLAIAGGFTALLAAIVMLTQTSVKVSLAWSTIAQMGFMLLQCGLGAFSIAVLHIVAHSLYKAHAFLSSGSVVELARSSRVETEKAAPGPMRMAGYISLALMIVLVTGSMLGSSPAEDPAIFAFGAIFVLGLGQLMVSSSLLAKGFAAGGKLIARTTGIAIVLSTAYFGLQKAAASLLANDLPQPLPADPAAIIIMALAVTSFATVSVLQLTGPGKTSAIWQRAHVHLANGLYANTLFNRFAGAFARPAGAKTFTEIA
jgi:NAD(P)H-quinone oxidoreductase subunit 5